MEVQQVVIGNLGTIIAIAVIGATCWLFEPYLPFLAWGQLFALALAGPRDRFKRKDEATDAAARRLMGIMCFALLSVSIFSVVGLGHDLAYSGSIIKSVAEQSSSAPSWLKNRMEPLIADLKPKVIEAASPYVLGLEALGTDECCELREDIIIEKAGLIDNEYEGLARQAINTANAMIKRGEIDNLDALKGEAKAKFEIIKAKFQQDEELKDQGKAAAQQALGYLLMILTGITRLLTALTGFVAASISSIVGAILFSIAVYAQLEREHDYISLLILQVAPAANNEVRTLQQVCESLIISPIFRAVGFGTASFVLVLLFGARCATTSALLAMASGLFYPFFPTLASSFPWALGLALSGSYLRAILFFIAHTLILSKIAKNFESALATSLALPVSFIRLAFILGFQRLGTKGVILGPLLLTIATLAFRVLAASSSGNVLPKDDDTTPTEEASKPPPLAEKEAAFPSAQEEASVETALPQAVPTEASARLGDKIQTPPVEYEAATTAAESKIEEVQKQISATTKPSSSASATKPPKPPSSAPVAKTPSTAPATKPKLPPELLLPINDSKSSKPKKASFFSSSKKSKK